MKTSFPKFARRHTRLLLACLILLMGSASYAISVSSSATWASVSFSTRALSPVAKARVKSVGGTNAAPSNTATATSLALPMPVATTVNVNDTTDTLHSPGCATTGVQPCSLRDAVIFTNSNPGTDTINLPAGTYTLSRVGNDATALNGDLDINDSVTIDGAGSGSTIIQGASAFNSGTGVYTGSIGDKVIGINQDGTHLGLTVNIQDVTIRWGQNTNVASPAFTHTGGGVDVFLTGVANNITFSNCVITENTNVNGYGGGVNIDSGTVNAPGDVAAGTANRGTVTFSGTTISNNRVTSSVNNWQGAGLNLYADIHNVTFTNSTITGNQALNTTFAGGMNIRHTNGGTVTLTNTNITNNTSSYDGGGLQITATANQVVNMTGGSISGNVAQGNDGSSSGGGLRHLGSTGAVTLSGVSITNNDSKVGVDARGGGVDMSAVTTAPLTLTNCTITGNESKNGAGIFMGDGVLNISGGTIQTNTATGQGGGMYVNGGTTTVTNNTAIGGTAGGQGNTAVDGGGVAVAGGSFTYTGTTTPNIAGNSASGNGGGIYLFDAATSVTAAAVTLNNVTIDNNTAASGDGLYQSSGGQPTTFTGQNTINFNNGDSINLLGGTFNSTSGTMNLTGNFTNSGATFNHTNGTVIFNGTGAQSLGGTTTSTFNNLTVNKSVGTTLTLGVNTLIDGNLNLTQGIFDLGAFTANHTAPAGDTLTVANGTTLLIGGTGTLPSNFTTHSIGATSTINYSGTNQSVATLNSGQEYGNLVTSGSGTKTLSGIIGINTSLTIGSGTTLDVNAAGNFNINFGGTSWTNNGTFTPRTATVTFDATGGTQTLFGNTTFYNLTLSNSSTTTNFGSTTTTIGNTFRKTAGTMNGGTSTIVFTGTPGAANGITGSSGKNFFNLQINSGADISTDATANNNLTIDGNFANAGTFTQDSARSTTFGANGTQNFSGAGTTNFGNITIQSTSTVNAGSHNFSVKGATFTATGTFTGSTSTVTFDGSAAQSITGNGAKNFSGLTINNANGVTLNNGSGAVDASVSGLLTLTTDLTVAASGILQQSGTSAGARDVIGTVRRTDLGATPRSFGNLNNTITINSGTAPNPMDVTLTKVAPPDFPAGIAVVPRTYTLTPTGGSGISATVKLRYIDPTETASVVESRLILWKKIAGTWTAQGGAVDMVNDFVSLSGVTSFSDWAIAEGSDLTVTKANSVGNNAVTGQTWTWTLTVSNTGAPATFNTGDTILTDNLPNSNITYGAVVVSNQTNITNQANISCSITSNDLTCTANGGPVTIGGAGSFQVSFTATASGVGTFTNPRAAGITRVDPGSIVIESNETNNDATANTVTVTAANTTTTISNALSLTTTPSVVTEPVTVQWSVTVNAPGTASTPLTGTVTVTAGADSCNAPVATGQCDITFTSAGLKSITAQYSGDTNYNGSTSSPATAHTVTAANTTTTITSDNPDPSSPGDSVTVNYTVTVNSPGTGVPTGNVVVTATGGETCTGTVAAGSCSLTLNTQGTTTLTAVYQANSNFNSSSDTEAHAVCVSNPQVTNTNPSGAGSLREAIANVCEGGTITFAAGVTGAINLTAASGGQLTIDKDMTIVGPGADVLAVRGVVLAGGFRVFNVTSGTVATISGLTIANGTDAAGGGGINNAGTLYLYGVAVGSPDSSIGGNNTTGTGGGILNSGTLVIHNSTVSNNVSTLLGGGGISNNGATATLTIINSTISGNSANGGGSGGGILNGVGATATLRNVTVAGNFADGDGGGIANSGTFNLSNTIVGDNTSTGVNKDLFGTFTSQDYNVIETTPAGFVPAAHDQTGDPRLGVLMNNGGPTLTHALKVGSIALDAGSDVALTTLDGAIIDVPTSITVADASTIPAGVGYTILIDSEQMVVTAKSGNVLTVTRGANGTTAAAHADGASLYPAFDQRQVNFKRRLDAADADETDEVDVGAFEAHPMIEDIQNVSTDEDVTINCVSFNVGDASEGFASLNPITVSSDNPGLATVTIEAGTSASNWCVKIVPVANQSGTANITVTVNGNNGYSIEDTFQLSVGATNDPPDAVDDSATVNEDSGPNAIDVLANDSFAPDTGETLTITGKTDGANGTVVITGGGTGLTYEPNANFAGSDSFTYTISDGNGGTDTATVNVTVTNLNDPPDAVDDSATIPEDNGATAVDVLANDTIAPDTGETLTITAKTDGANGAVVITGGGTGLTYQPNANYSGSDSFTYTISDGNGGTDTATVNVTVTNTNDPPDAVDDNTTVGEDSGATAVDVLANDTITPDTGETLTITAKTDGANGTVVITGGGTGLTYQPNANYFGSDSFTYTISDGNGGTDTATVNVTINNSNDPPDAVDDSATVAEDSGANGIDVLVNDTISPDTGETLTITSRTNGANGSVAIAGGGTSVTYAPNANFSGSDSFTYTISDGNGGTDTATVNVTVTNTNDPPDAVDDTATVAEDSGANAINVLANDTITPDTGETLTITAKTDGANGTVTITGGGTGLTYTPNANYFGSDSFTYDISDGNGGTDTATVNVTVTNANDPPDAVDDSATVAEDSGANAITVLANDTITPDTGETLTITAKTDGANGVVVITGGGTGLTYQPNANYFGADSFTYTISDGNGGVDTATVNVTVTNTNDPPDAVDDSATIAEDSAATAITVLANDTIAPDTGETLTITAKTDGTNGTVVITGGGTGLTYAPNANFAGSDSFTYTISDGNGGTDTATVNVTVTGTNDPPDAVDDSATVAEDSGANAITVLSNDTITPDTGETLTITGKTNGANGTVVITGGGTGLTYQPNANYFGADSFTYTISDGNGGTDTATVNVTVTNVNDPPDAVDDATTIVEDSGANAVSVLANDTITPDTGETLTITGKTNGTNGTVVITGGGTGLTYQPNANYFGADSFTYTISDGNGGTDTATVNVTVSAINDAPSFTKGADQTVDEDAGAQSVAWATAISAGPNESSQTVDFIIVTNSNTALFSAQPAISATGQLTYTPAADKNGTATITVKIHDDGGTVGGGVNESATQSFTITVDAVNDAPTFDIASNPPSVGEDAGAQSISSFASNFQPGPATATDEAGQTVVGYTVTQTGTTGNVTFTSGPSINSAGTLTYTPTANTSGTATYNVTVTDNGGTANGGVNTSVTPETFTITVTGQNDAPVLDDTGNMSLAAINEDVANASNPGTLISDIIASAGGDRITDADAGAVEGIAITTVNNTNGSWQFSINNGTNWTALGSPDATTARLLAADANTRVRFIPNANFNGTVNPGITFRAWDTTSGANGGTADVSGGGGGTTAFSLMTETASITVNPVNDKPTANAQSVATAEDTPLNITLTGSDVETGSNSLVYTVGSPAHGVLSGTAPNLTYTPNSNYSGPDSFTFTVTDTGDGASPALTSDSATISITVGAVNDPPVANAQSVTTDEDTPKIIPLTGSDVDASSGTLSYIIVTGPAHGTLTGVGASRTYTPTGNYNGPDSFTFKINDGTSDSNTATISITVTAVNDAPTADAQTVSTNEDTPKAITLSGSDTETAAANLTFTITVQPANGTLTGTGANRTYTPNANFNGSDSFKFTVTDTGDGASPALTSSAATVSITVNAVNDAPSFTKGPDQTTTDSNTHTVANWATSISAGPADESGQSLTFQVTNDNNALFATQPAISPTGTLTYKPVQGAVGSATVTVTLKDNGGTANGGVDTSAAQTFTITLNAQNGAPTLDAINDLTIDEDAPQQTVNLSGITSGPSYESNQTLTVTATSSNTAVIPNPTVTYTSPNTTGTLKFTPVANANGSAIITVTVKDNGGTSGGGVDTTTRTFTVTVNPINDAPVNNVPGNQSAQLYTPHVFSAANSNLVSIADVDAGSDALRVTLKATNGTISLSQTTGLTFTTGDGTDDVLMTFTGSITNINAALNGMTFTAAGNGLIEMTTNDLGHNGAGGELTDTDTITMTAVTSSFMQFNASSYQVTEGAEQLGAAQVEITVTRTGNLSTPASVDYATSDGTAKDWGDYNTARGTLHFAAGQQSASFFIMINDDGFVEVPENFQVKLSNATLGVGLGIPSTATVTITDNDTSQPSGNTTDNIDDFIRQLYHDFLDREPEAEGFQYWTSILRGCGNDAECLNRVRVEIASRFFQEMEFQQTGYFVMRLYKAAYGRFPTFLEFIADRRLVGASTESQRAFAENFTSRPAFTAIYGSLSNEQFVKLLYDTANLKPYTSERAQQVHLLGLGKSRAQVLHDLVEINEFRTREFNPAFVRMMYFGFLRRDAEADGEAYWLNVITNLTPNNYRGMICAFLNSAEYHQRFSSVRGRFTEGDCTW